MKRFKKTQRRKKSNSEKKKRVIKWRERKGVLFVQYMAKLKTMVSQSRQIPLKTNNGELEASKAEDHFWAPPPTPIPLALIHLVWMVVTCCS